MLYEVVVWWLGELILGELLGYEVLDFVLV